MLVMLLFTFIICSLLTIFGLIIYMVSVLLEDTTEEDGHNLGVDTQDFNRTPVSSPNERHENDERQTTAEQEDCNCTRARRGARGRAQPDSSSPDSVPSRPGTPQVIDAIATTVMKTMIQPAKVALEDFKSAEMNSKLLAASEREKSAEDRPESGREAASVAKTSSPPNPQANDTAASGADAAVWSGPPEAQKSRIASELGSAAAKQVLADLDPRSMQLGGTALHWCKTRATLNKLINLGIPIELKNGRGETALHVAVRKHKLQVLIGLIIHSASIESRNALDETPLIAACKARNIFAVQLLLIFEADLDWKDKFGYSARHHTSMICEHNKTKQNDTPSAAHLILAMLNELGARRCPLGLVANKTESLPKKARASRRQSGAATGSAATNCPEGCSATGVYNGNSYNRWPNFKRESLYKRHMFNDIIETKLREARERKRSGGGRRDAARPEPTRLLCIDGGGLRGVIVCQIMIEMEKYLKRPMISYFDWMGGTSVGAFLACALSLGAPLKVMRQVCFDVKDEVFAGTRPYNSKFLERVLKRTFGPTTRFSDIKDRKLAVTTVLADREPCQLRLFRNYTSPARMLERYGYASDTFNNMSGHSVPVEQAGKSLSLKSLDATMPKSSAARSSLASAAKAKLGSLPTIPEEGGTVDAIFKQLDANVQKVADGMSPALDARRQLEEETLDMAGRANKSITSDGAAKESKAASGQSKTRPNANKEAPAPATESNAEAMLEENDPDPIIWQAVRASSAAPFFFRPYGPYLDGGIISNNPTLDMLNEIESYNKVRQFLRKNIKTTDIPPETRNSLLADTALTGRPTLVVSLGTGRGRVISRQTMMDFGQVATGFATVFSPMELVRSIKAAKDFFKKLIQQSCHTDDYILDRGQGWCSMLDIPYFRLNPPLATIFSIDDKRDEQLINALWQTKLYMIAMKDQLKELAELLDGPN